VLKQSQSSTTWVAAIFIAVGDDKKSVRAFERLDRRPQAGILQQAGKYILLLLDARPQRMGL